MPSRKPNSTSRRDFLFGKSAVEAIRESVVSIQARVHGTSPGEADPAAEYRAEGPESSYWEQYTKRAMACEFEVLFNLQQYPQSAAAVAVAFELIDQLEDQLTVYRDHSEVSRINRFAGEQSLPVEPKLFSLLQTALELYRQTGGAFDITSARLSQLWKFDRRAGSLPDPAKIQQALSDIGSDQFELNADHQTIKFNNPNLQINLGGIGKGFAIDQAAQRLRQQGIENFAIHGGQSSVKTGGQESSPAGAGSEGWWIGLSHPLIPASRLGKVRLLNQALGTSGTGRQGFFHRGIRYGHILDPRTGWPTSHFLSTTVIADSAAICDALATAFFVMSVDQVASYCTEHPDVKAILISDPAMAESNHAAQEQERSGQLLLQTFNIDDQALMLNL